MFEVSSQDEFSSVIQDDSRLAQNISVDNEVEVIDSNANDERQNVLQEMECLVKSLTAEKEQDSVDLFCDSIKENLREVPSSRILLCKAKILTVIAEHTSSSG